MTTKKQHPFDDQLQWLRIYAIYDKKGARFDTPFFAHSDLFAKRRYLIMAEEEKSPLRMWPEEFEMYLVGRFNIKSATVIEQYELILEGSSIANK